MRIVFKKIPKLAMGFYVCGFILIGVAFYLFFNQNNWVEIFPLIRVQQLFIVGAIIVAIGSVINNLSQFKKNK